MAHEQDALEKLFQTVKVAHKNLDERLRPRLDRGGGSKYELRFPEINSKIYCDLESRGDTISRLHISEYAFVKDIKRVKATLQAVPKECPVTVESTANGLNEFYDLYFDPDAPYVKFFFPWFMILSGFR